jgi:hypothetical protein
MPERRQKRRRALQTPFERAIFWLGWWLFCFVLWMLLVFKTEALEFVAGAVAAALAATAAELVRSLGYAPFAGELRWLRWVARLPREVAVDCAVLTRALWLQLAGKRRIEGSFRVIHFEGCGGDDPHSEARRAVAKWLGGVSPNAYVVGFDEKREIVLVHQLVRTDEPPDVDPESRAG